MSGGHFDYKQYQINDMSYAVEELIKADGWPEAVIEEFRIGLDHLRRAAIYAQRIDWLVSGDDGVEAFHERLAEELAALSKSKGDN